MRSHFQRQLYPGLKDVIFNSFNELPAQYPQLFNVETSTKAFEEFQTVAGLGLFVKTPEGVEAQQDQMTNGYYSRFDHEEYSQAVGFTHQAIRDLQTRLFRDRAMDMGRSARATEETIHAALLNLAFDGAQLGADGKSLCATDHPMREGTQSNIIDPVGTVSVTTIRRMLTKARRLYDDTGVRRITLKWDKLIVPPEEEWAAREALQSAGNPETANRADNVIKGMLTPFVYNFLTDEHNFFMQAAPGQHKLYVFIREAFYTREYEEERRLIEWIQGRFVHSHGFPHYMGIVGSNPS